MKTYEMTHADSKVIANMRAKNSYGINDIIACCTPLIEAGAAKATTIGKQIEIERRTLGIPLNDWPETILTQLVEKYFRCHSGLLSQREHDDMTQQQSL